MIYGVREQIDINVNTGLRSEKNKQDKIIVHVVCDTVGVGICEEDIIESKRAG